MRELSVGTRLFALTQLIVLIAIAVAIYLHWRRQRERSKGQGIGLDNIDLRSAIRRAPIPPASKPTAGGDAATAPPFEGSAPPRVESAFPSWTADTPAHEILGIPPTASFDTVEAAYKQLLKKYHPDRFAHWGKGYQNRAHHVVLLLQSAREKLSGKR